MFQIDPRATVDMSLQCRRSNQYANDSCACRTMLQMALQSQHTEYTKHPLHDEWDPILEVSLPALIL